MEKNVPFEVASLFLYNNSVAGNPLQQLLNGNAKSRQEGWFLNSSMITKDCFILYNEQLLWVFSRGSAEPRLCEGNKFEECFRKFEITEKKFIDFLFEKEFSNNLMEIFVDGECIYDYFEEQFLYGTQLNLSKEYEKIIRKNDVQIIDIKLQPLNMDTTITLRNENIIEFSNKTNLKENLHIINILTKYIMNYLRTEGKGDSK
ncbi:hypothetical protein ACQKNT_27310 [Bacillus cereus]|uniref:hypothetical protein n=1 Tax=Bacillus cereus group TaxID=86661 RepID=UPI000279BBD3|nr:hypothetical protein [Bacillus cereus]EJR82307.1 hypothetical protein IKA_05439 [Bacillus cereus VD169]